MQEAEAAGKYSIGGLESPLPPPAPKPDAGGAGLGGLLALGVLGFVLYQMVRNTSPSKSNYLVFDIS